MADDDADLLVVTGNGYGKRTALTEYPRKGRPTKGVRTIKVSDKKGELITARIVRGGQQLLLMSELGQVIRIEVDAVKRMGRSTEGVRLMDVSDDDRVMTAAPVEESDEPIGDELEGEDGEVTETTEATEGDIEVLAAPDDAEDADDGADDVVFDAEE